MGDFQFKQPKKKMKLKLPNGLSLYLWDSEVKSIQITDSQIIVKTSSGKNIDIELPVSWMNHSLKPEAILRNEQTLPSNTIPLLPLQTNDSQSREVEPLSNRLDANMRDLKSHLEKILEVQTMTQMEVQKKLEDFKLQFRDLDLRIQDWRQILWIHLVLKKQ